MTVGPRSDQDPRTKHGSGNQTQPNTDEQENTGETKPTNQLREPQIQNCEEQTRSDGTRPERAPNHNKTETDREIELLREL